MNIGYADDEIYKICTDKRYAYKKIGKNTADKLFRKLQVISMFENLQEFYDAYACWRPHPLKANLVGFHTFDLDGPKRVIYHPVDSSGEYSCPETSYTSINCVMIKEVSIHYGD